MTINEAVERMNALAKAAEERLSAYGFDTKIESEYMNTSFQTVEDPKKAKFVTTALVVSGEGIRPRPSKRRIKTSFWVEDPRPASAK